VQRVNGELEEFVRQLNQRTVESLIDASIHEQINEIANDFAQRMSDLEARILSQVPEKNEMIDHIRVITEGSLEAHVREMATNVAQEVSNSVATETVENMLDQQFARYSLASQESSSNARPWLLGLLAAGVVGLGLYFYFFN
jgi:dGTP triphosphohydrolase